MADGSGAPWLFGIARNLLRQYHKHNRIETAARERLGLPLAFAECEDYERGRRAHRGVARWRPALRIAVRALPAEQRAALELRVVQQLDYEEVAGALGCSQNAARLRVSRALRALTVELGGDDSDDACPTTSPAWAVYLEVAAGRAAAPPPAPAGDGELHRRRDVLAVPFALAVAAADLAPSDGLFPPPAPAGLAARSSRRPTTFMVRHIPDEPLPPTTKETCLDAARLPRPRHALPHTRLRPGGTEMAVTARPAQDPAARRRARPHGAPDPRLARAAVARSGRSTSCSRSATAPAATTSCSPTSSRSRRRC